MGETHQNALKPITIEVPAGLDEILKDLSREVLRNQPVDINKFCAEYFQLKVDEREGVVGTKASSSKPSRAQGNATTSHAVQKNIKEEGNGTDESSGEADDEPIAPPPVAKYNRGRRESVSAESMTPQAGDNRQLRVIPKSDEQKLRIRAAVKNSFLFRSLDEEQYKEVVNAMEEKTVPSGTEVIVQGDVGDNFYVVEKGTLDVFVTAKGEKRKVASLGYGNSFGELALMYNAPRAATVATTSECILWALDRVTFRRILLDNTNEKRKMYDAFLNDVPLLKSLDSSQRAKISEALEPRTYGEGEVVIRQGEPGEEMFLVESGFAIATKVDETGSVTELMKYGRGGYFGELALLNEEPRKATVTATGELKVAVLNKQAFDRLLGTLKDLIKENSTRYDNLKSPNSNK